MTHEDVTKRMTAEGYLLNELAPEERDAFEEHFFGCPECALDLQIAAAFLDQARVQLPLVEQAAAQTERPPAVRASRGLGWAQGWALGWTQGWAPAWALSSLALLLALSVGLNLSQRHRMERTVASLESPRILPGVPLMKSNARAGSIPVVQVRTDQAFLLYVDIPAEARYSSYTAALYDPAGAEDWSVPIPAEETNNTLPIQSFPPKQGSGVYVLKVQGVAADGSAPATLEELPFRLEEQ